jgi:hypothetical protein
MSEESNRNAFLLGTVESGGRLLALSMPPSNRDAKVPFEGCPPMVSPRKGGGGGAGWGGHLVGIVIGGLDRVVQLVSAETKSKALI